MADRRPSGGELSPSAGIAIRPFQEKDATAVRDLFVRVNRLLSPPGMHDAFEAYIARSMTEEIGRIADYYGERGGGFWVALRDGAVAGEVANKTV